MNCWKATLKLTCKNSLKNLILLCSCSLQSSIYHFNSMNSISDDGWELIYHFSLRSKSLHWSSPSKSINLNIWTPKAVIRGMSPKAVCHSCFLGGSNLFIITYMNISPISTSRPALSPWFQACIPHGHLKHNLSSRSLTFPFPSYPLIVALLYLKMTSSISALLLNEV